MTIEIPKDVEVIEVVGLKEWLEEHDKQIRTDAIDDCLVLVDKIMPPQPYLLKSKHYENWKMKTTELRMLRDMIEQLKEQK